MAETERSKAVRQVFSYWAKVMHRPRTKLDEKRRGKIRMRLDDGYTIEDLENAITGYTLSAFHMGENSHGRPYNDIELICRDGTHVDAGIDLYENGARRPVSNRLSSNIAAAKNFIGAPRS